MDVARLSSRALCASTTNFHKGTKQRTPGCRVQTVGAATKTKTSATAKPSWFNFRRRNSIPEEPPRDDSKFVLPYTAAAATLGAACGFQVVAAPELTALYGLGDSLPEVGSIQNAVSYTPAALAALVSLRQAARSNRLNSQTYTRLNTGLFLWQGACLLNVLLRVG
eukprot:CAMPEP_0118950202 /NCGR_PEP_ID=MMETSP1169-20130426/50959_1 /TAXON_ID=36882 /ORGANISM="Pyramimonas obovata, Strain CCMP722" /LENGTH=165 /DNA_ID=CAMNT_0006896987 /DNA_START=78 /DNA_END=571 /DNA_ORIENTATION=+